ncbi:hypothetical protein FYK55_04985 [Roseiconus nitratireducens]|uniref:ATP synthase epsilon chain n=1 Tax=Roseiconus nitratireducens TaxID=2605748 RepID=A0A5M6DFA4_9BACT|nr:hypothetical protein [Roseiconus nitratireducens]KAA5546244.1 hypothetical protein FYK55_04985 [Roseiconus nitratireducens]
MSTRTLTVTIRTPLETVYQEDVSAMRVPTESGQVGLRPRMEPGVLAVEPGLISLRIDDQERYAGTAGGLLRVDRQRAQLLSPLAVIGDDVGAVAEQLDHLLSQPSEELEVRRTLDRLQTRLLQELRGQDEAGESGRGQR